MLLSEDCVDGSLMELPQFYKESVSLSAWILFLRAVKSVYIYISCIRLWAAWEAAVKPSSEIRLTEPFKIWQLCKEPTTPTNVTAIFGLDMHDLSCWNKMQQMNIFTARLTCFSISVISVELTVQGLNR